MKQLLLMRHIKMFDSLIPDKLAEDLCVYYRRYLNKFFIVDNSKLSRDSNITMCKMLKIEQVFINWEEYEYDDFEKGYQVMNRSLHIRDFNKYYKILKSFDTFEEMKNEYNILLTANKYNL